MTSPISTLRSAPAPPRTISCCACCQNLARFNPGKLEWSNDAAKTITQVSETEIDFELNPGQMFHGGYGEMTAEDVKFSLERFIKPDASGKKAAYADDFAALDRVEVTGTYTGKIMLKNPAPAFWVIGLCDGSGAILSKKAVEALGDKIAHDADRLRSLSGQGLEAEGADRARGQSRL